MADPNDFVELFFDTPRLNWVVIFHCEFSHNRGPKMAMQFRDYDRSVNKVSYPALYYPQTFILDGGYRDFYEHYPELCDGQYVPMLEETHRRNGDLSRCTSDYQEVVSSFDKILHPSANRGLHTHLMSPKQRRLCQSPVTKTMCCLSSPRCLHKRSDEMFQAQMTGFGPEFA
jgi:M-phase inducer tyrosine phosphatase